MRNTEFTEYTDYILVQIYWKYSVNSVFLSLSKKKMMNISLRGKPAEVDKVAKVDLGAK